MASLHVDYGPTLRIVAFTFSGYQVHLSHSKVMIMVSLEYETKVLSVLLQKVYKLVTIIVIP